MEYFFIHLNTSKGLIGKSMTFSYQRIKTYTPIVFWVFQVIIHIIRNIYVIINDSFWHIFHNIQVTYPLDIIAFCVFYYFFAPSFYRKDKISKSIVLSIAFIIIHSFLWFSVFYFLTKKQDYSIAIAISSIGHSLLYAFYGILCRIVIEWFRNREKQKILEKKKTETELALLRSQINPHFLFNTLNNINTLVFIDQQKTYEAIIKLSEIMRYMHRDQNPEYVTLEKEVEYIENYVELQKLRFKKNYVHLDIFIENPNLLIAPMIFIAFVENAFKHCNRKQKEPSIEISIFSDKKSIELVVRNYYAPKKQTDNSSGGFGIKNIKERLSLIYKDNYTLNIDDREGIFYVVLKLGLLNGKGNDKNKMYRN